jgi:periplasmic protein TonB
MKSLAQVMVFGCAVVALSSGVGAQGGKEPVYPVGSGITSPQVVRQVNPGYTEAAKKAGIQGTVPLECVVLPNGTVADVKVVRSLEPGLDENAVKALRKWTFKPGTKDGKPVAVKVSVDMTYSLRNPAASPLFPIAPIKPPGH